MYVELRSIYIYTRMTGRRPVTLVLLMMIFIIIVIHHRTRHACATP